MNSSLRVVFGVVAAAGLVNEGIKAREADPFTPSLQSVFLIFLYSIMLFVAGLKKFHKIPLNIGIFDFDSHCLGGSMYLIRDRSTSIFKAIGLKSLSPPK